MSHCDHCGEDVEVFASSGKLFCAQCGHEANTPVADCQCAWCSPPEADLGGEA